MGGGLRAHAQCLLSTRCLARRPDAAQPWQAEQAKLLWAQGQPGMALRLARALLADAPRWAGRPEAGAERASLLSRTGKWIAQSRRALLCLLGSANTAHHAVFDVAGESAVQKVIP